MSSSHFQNVINIIIFSGHTCCIKPAVIFPWGIGLDKYFGPLTWRGASLLLISWDLPCDILFLAWALFNVHTPDINWGFKELILLSQICANAGSNLSKVPWEAIHPIVGMHKFGHLAENQRSPMVHGLEFFGLESPHFRRISVNGEIQAFLKVLQMAVLSE